MAAQHEHHPKVTSRLKGKIAYGLFGYEGRVATKTEDRATDGGWGKMNASWWVMVHFVGEK